MYGAITVLTLITLFAVSFPALGEGPCEEERTRWGRTFEELKKTAEDYRRIKLEAITPILNEMTAKGIKGSIAFTIQSALKKRADLMAEAAGVCQSAINEERVAYDSWRRCSAAGQQRRGPSSVPGPATISRERDRLMADLQDLFLDEGYAQYKGQAPESAQWGYEPEQRGAPQNDRWTGYQGAPSRFAPGYEGYYR